MFIFLLCTISFLISFITVALIKQRFSQLLLDIPNERSSHTQPTPRGGGLGFIVGFAGSSLGALAFAKPEAIAFTPQTLLILWLILLPLALIGIIDDRRDVPAAVRYLVQIATAGITVTYFHPFPQPWLTSVGFPGVVIAFTLTLIGFTAFINFYNFMDGLDGLVAGVSIIQLSFLTVYLDLPFLWLLVAAVAGFLWWNWSPAKIFMGDAGSTVLGATIAIALLIPDNSPTQAWSALAITLPLVGDAIYTIIRRLLKGENIFKAHRSHLYQRLQQQGWSHRQVALTYMILTALASLSIIQFGLMGAGITLVSVITMGAIAEGWLQKKASESSNPNLN
jgi:Fuc2NAc and GlcNAc transferase